MASSSSEGLKTVTWNPVTGCDRVSAGCDNCYALALVARLKAMGVEKYQADGDPATSGPGFGPTMHPRTLGQPRHWRRPRVVFVNSMSDLFHPGVPVSFIREAFDVMAETPQHTYQLLTKRPGRARKISDKLDWPPNLWLGTSVEDGRVVRRVDLLRDTPARLKFIFFEPLLGSLDGLNLDGIGWVSVAGGSGPNHRPMEEEWVTSIRDQCVAADVPFYFKQGSGRTARAAGRQLEGGSGTRPPTSRRASLRETKARSCPFDHDPGGVTMTDVPHGPARVAGERARELALAREELRAKDPVMRGLIDANPDLDHDAWRRTLPVEGLFEALLFQIVGQQISVKAADAIYARLRALFADGRPSPEVLAETSVDELRATGLSARKAEYVKDLARRTAGGELDGLADLSHEEARGRLVSFRGIGPWTADGALLIAFGWPDVLVSGDLVLRKAVRRAYGLPNMPSEKEVEAMGERWRPHRSVAAGYLFESMMGA